MALISFLHFEVKANSFPNGWKQVGKNCIKDSKDYYKLQKKSDSFGFNTFFEYGNDYEEFSNPKFEDKYSLNVGYDF